MAVRFLIDENLLPLLASVIAHGFGFDAVDVNMVGLRGASDADVLGFARAEDRLIVTSNARDFRAVARSSPWHPGLIISSGSLGRHRQIADTTALITRADALFTALSAARHLVFEVCPGADIRQYGQVSPL